MFIINQTFVKLTSSEIVRTNKFDEVSASCSVDMRIILDAGARLISVILDHPHAHCTEPVLSNGTSRAALLIV